MILNLALDLPEDGSFIKIARLMSRTLLEHMRVVRQDVEDIEFVIGELCANVTRHSHSMHGRFRVELEYYADRVYLSVIDNGGGFSFRDVLPIGATRPDANGEERIGGFGLHLVELLSDHLEFRRTEPHGTTVRAEKYLHYENKSDELLAESMDTKGGVAATISRP